MTSNNKKNTTESVTEIGLDIISSISGLPFSSTIKAVKNGRDNLYIKKLQSFFESLNSIPQDELTQLISKLESDEEEKIKVGENILLIIERLDNMDKPKIFGNMFLDYLKSNITKEDFWLLAKALDNFNLVYTPQFIDYFQNYNENISFPAKQHFGLCGLAAIILNDGSIGSGGGYGRSELGKLFLKYII